MSEQSAVPSRNGLAVAALILGIVAMVLSLVVIGALLGLIAAVLGILALRNPARRGSAIVGIVTGVLSIPMAVVMALLLALMVPVFGAARNRARESVAATHMRGLLTGTMIYAAEYNNLLPPHIANLERNLGGDATYLLDPRGKTPPLALPPNTDWTSDPSAVEAHCDFWYAAASVRLTAVRRPSDFLVFYDKPDMGRMRVLGFADGHIQTMRAGSPEIDLLVEQNNRERAALKLPLLPPQLQGPPPPVERLAPEIWK